MGRNGIRHITSAPYHPATNGLAERMVQTFKNAMKKANPGDIETAIARFLFHYRTTPHSTTGVSPAELLLGRQPRTHNVLLRPSITNRVRNAQQRQTSSHDVRVKERTFNLSDPVYVKNFHKQDSQWLPGEITKINGPRTFTITLTTGKVVRRHIEHIRLRTCDDHVKGSEDDYDFLQSSQPPTAEPIDNPRRSSRIRNAPARLM